MKTLLSNVNETVLMHFEKNIFIGMLNFRKPLPSILIIKVKYNRNSLWNYYHRKHAVAIFYNFFITPIKVHQSSFNKRQIFLLCSLFFHFYSRIKNNKLLKFFKF